MAKQGSQVRPGKALYNFQDCPYVYRKKWENYDAPKL